MTREEMIALLDALLRDVTLAGVRNGREMPSVLDGLSDEEYVLLVKWLADPEGHPEPVVEVEPRPAPQVRPPVPIPDELEHEDEVPPRPYDVAGVTLFG